jgi:hypothetical protein
MTTDPRVKNLRDAQRRLRSALIANADRLDKPFTDDPDKNPWDTFVRPAMRGLEAAVDAIAAAPAAVPPTDRAAAAPVKQRADLTEAEWAEQERARFERLYTREFSRAETAVRDADIYRARLERLGEGYTRERKRAERAEAEAERLRTHRDATCICQHTKQQHFEDACLVCECGDYLAPEAAREVIARWRDAATGAAAVHRPALPETPLPGPYRHYKGGHYQVVATARHTESGEQLVVYRSGGDWWCRPQAEFCGTVEVDGGEVSRFTPAVPLQPKRPPMDPVHILGILAEPDEEPAP